MGQWRPLKWTFRELRFFGSSKNSLVARKLEFITSVIKSIDQSGCRGWG